MSPSDLRLNEVNLGSGDLKHRNGQPLGRVEEEEGIPLLTLGSAWQRTFHSENLSAPPGGGGGGVFPYLKAG